MVVNLSLYHSLDFDYCINVCANFTLFSFSCRFLAGFWYVSLGCVDSHQGLLVVDKSSKFIFGTVSYTFMKKL